MRILTRNVVVRSSLRQCDEDLKWLGIKWQEGPDCGGRFGPYSQSERRPFYFEAWKKLREEGWIYPCSCSRKDLAAAAAAPNEGDDEPSIPVRAENVRMQADLL